MENIWLFGLLFWLVLWPVTLICIVLQYFIAKTEGKYNGMIIPGFMFVIPFFFSFFMFASSDAPPALPEIVLSLIITVLTSSIIPLAMFWFYHLVHTSYLKTKYKNSDADRMKIHDL